MMESRAQGRQKQALTINYIVSISYWAWPKALTRYTKTLYQPGYCKGLEVVSPEQVKGQFLFGNVQDLDTSI